MNRPLALAAAALLAWPAAAQAPAAATAPEPLPGRWEYRYRVLLIPAGTEYWCLKPAEVNRAFDGPCNRHHTCTYPVKEAANGRVRLRGEWRDKRGRVAPVSGEGTYAATTMSLRFRGRTIQGLPFSGRMDARRISDICQPGDK